MGKITKMISQQLPDLPLEIITDILSLLPVKTLMRFKCVSKSFFSLISTPQFVKTHLDISSNDPNLTHLRFILKSDHHLFQSFSIPSVISCNPDNALEVDYPSKYTDYPVSIVGSLNGLVCINTKNYNLFIWNPSTRASKRLPDTGLEKQSYTDVYGFGFDECTDDYKVVSIFRYRGNEGSNYLVVWVYSLKADSWKIIGDIPSGHLCSEQGKFANGSLHWIMSMSFFQGDQSVILSLDLSSEKYGEIELPNYSTHYCYLNLGVLQGCLCVLAFIRVFCSDLWVMKKYGVRDSWEKLCTIKFAVDQGVICYLFPYLILSSGEILMEFEGKLVLYNPIDGAFKVTKVFNLDNYMAGVTYVESLVSPNI